MATISILLILSFTLFFIFTREGAIRIRRTESLRVEIHFQIIAFIIDPQKRSRKDGKEKSSSESRRIVLKAARRLLKTSRVTLNSLVIPYSANDGTVTKLARYRIYSAAIISYIETLSQEFSLRDNAITLSPDIQSIQYDLSIKCRLYKIVYSLVKLGIHKLKEKLYVRE